MQSIELTTGLLLIILVAAAAIFAVGYLLSIVLQGRKPAEASLQLEQATTQIQQLQAENKKLNSALHEKAVEETRLQTQLSNLQEAERRLNAELAERKDEVTNQRTALEETNKQSHAIEKRLETSQAENLSLKDQMLELRERLAHIGDELKQERNTVSTLKEDLAQEGKKAKELESSNFEAREQLKETKQNLAVQTANYAQLQERFQSLSNEYTELKTTLEKREEHFKEQMDQLAETKQSLTKEFENLANKIFEEKGKTFTQTSQTSIDTMLKPFREQIEGFQKRINEVHDASLQGNTSLNSEIKKVLEIGMQMSKEANNLTSALKGDSQQRGAWGEAQLRRTLEMSGLIEDAHYEVQSSFKDSEGKQKQTDYLIKLPDGKHIIIDSKVTLNAYDRAIAAETPEEYQLAMVEHVKAVRKHIDDLSAKDYTNLVGMRSPSFVLMFMPIEPAYIEALKNNKDLFEYGYKKGIVLVSHTTLIPILRTVSNLWMIERSNAEAREISEKAGEIYNQVCTVAERLGKLGGTLTTVSNHYNETVKALSGKQGLYGKVERFTRLSNKVSKTLPPLDVVHMDFESDRLSMIAEPIEEPEDHETTGLHLPDNTAENVLAGEP
jgi:DNA recombination protein RmuC